MFSHLDGNLLRKDRFHGQNASFTNQEPQKPAIYRERFPSSDHWEALWEADVTLVGLRAKATEINANAHVFGNKRFAQGLLRIKRSSLRHAVAALLLGKLSAERLFSDVLLISWSCPSTWCNFGCATGLH